MSDFDYFTDKTDESPDGEAKGELTEVPAEISEQESQGTGERTDSNSFTDSFSGVSFFEPKNEQPNERYEEIFDSTKPKTVGFSIASMVLGIVSVVCCCFGWTGLIFGALAIAFSIVSRKVLGYFDGMSIAGLIVGIFGVCFGGLIIAFGFLAEVIYEMLPDIGDGIPATARFVALLTNIF